MVVVHNSWEAPQRSTYILLQGRRRWPIPRPTHHPPRRRYFVPRPASRLISSRRASASRCCTLSASRAAFLRRSSSSFTTIQTRICQRVSRTCSYLLRTLRKRGRGGGGGHQLGLSDLEYSFSRVTNSSNSCSRSSRFSMLCLSRSGLYRERSSSSVGVSQYVNAGPPTLTTAPLSSQLVSLVPEPPVCPSPGRVSASFPP